MVPPVALDRSPSLRITRPVLGFRPELKPAQLSDSQTSDGSERFKFLLNEPSKVIPVVAADEIARVFSAVGVRPDQNVVSELGTFVQQTIGELFRKRFVVDLQPFTFEEFWRKAGSSNSSKYCETVYYGAALSPQITRERFAARYAVEKFFANKKSEIEAAHPWAPQKRLGLRLASGGGVARRRAMETYFMHRASSALPKQMLLGEANITKVGVAEG